MVELRREISGKMGMILLSGAFTGVAICFTSVVVLVLLGQNVSPWPFSMMSWWEGDYSALRICAGAGMLLLGASPVAMLLMFLFSAIRQRIWPSVVVGFLLVVVVGVSLLMAMAD